MAGLEKRGATQKPEIEPLIQAPEISTTCKGASPDRKGTNLSSELAARGPLVPRRLGPCPSYGRATDRGLPSPALLSLAPWIWLPPAVVGLAAVEMRRMARGAELCVMQKAGFGNEAIAALGEAALLARQAVMLVLVRM